MAQSRMTCSDEGSSTLESVMRRMISVSQSLSMMHSGPCRNKRHCVTNKCKALLLKVLLPNQGPCVGRDHRELCNDATLTETRADAFQVFGVRMSLSGTASATRHMKTHWKKKAEAVDWCNNDKEIL